MNIRERLSAAHAKDLRNAILDHHDSDPIFIDALSEINRLRAGMEKMATDGCGCDACNMKLFAEEL